MDPERVPNAAKLAVGVLGAFFLYQLVTSLNLSRKRRAYARSKGCLPAPAYPQWDKVFGWDMFSQNIKALKAHNFLDLSYRRFQQMGVNTYQFVALGLRMHVTIEPENLKVIQAVEFKKWGLGKMHIEYLTCELADAS